MRPIGWVMEHADELAQEIVDAWEVKTQAEVAPMSGDFKDLFDKACQYRIAKAAAEERRQMGDSDLNRVDTIEEEAAREAFAAAYKRYDEADERDDKVALAESDSPPRARRAGGEASGS